LTLGDDTIPALAAAVDRLPPVERMEAVVTLQARKRQLDLDEALQSPLAWNLSRERAREALAGLPQEP
jgi:NADPH-dependent ferric siderophore reductase